MKGKEIIETLLKAEMPDQERVQAQCALGQPMEPAPDKRKPRIARLAAVAACIVIAAVSVTLLGQFGKLQPSQDTPILIQDPTPDTAPDATPSPAALTPAPDAIKDHDRQLTREPTVKEWNTPHPGSNGQGQGEDGKGSMWAEGFTYRTVEGTFLLTAQDGTVIQVKCYNEDGCVLDNGAVMEGGVTQEVVILEGPGEIVHEISDAMGEQVFVMATGEVIVFDWAPVSDKKAEEIALEKAGGGTVAEHIRSAIVDQELWPKAEAYTYVHEIDVLNGSNRMKLKIDLNTGEVLSFDQNLDSGD